MSDVHSVCVLLPSFCASGAPSSGAAPAEEVPNNNRFRFGDVALAPACAAGAREELRGATRGSIRDHTATDSCADPPAKDPAVEEGSLKPPRFFWQVRRCVVDAPFSEAVSPTATDTESPARVREGRAKKAVEAAAAKKAVEDAAVKRAVEAAVAKKAVEDAAAKKAVEAAAAKKAVGDSAAKKAVEDSAAKKAVEDAAAQKAVEAAVAKKAVEDAAAKKAVEGAAAKKAVDNGLFIRGRPAEKSGFNEEKNVNNKVSFPSYFSFFLLKDQRDLWVRTGASCHAP